MKKAVIAILVVIALAVGWFLISPLFIDRTVDEDFDFVTDTGSVDMDAVMAMPDEKRQAMKDDIMDVAANAPDQAASEDMPDNQPSIVASGQFVDADAVHKGSGRAILYRLPDGRHVVRFEDFRTTNGPDLVVYLAKHASPRGASDVTDGGFLSLGKLKGNIGNQNYEVPAGTVIEDFNSVVIWCELFGVLFSPAALSPEEPAAGGTET